MSTYRGTEHFGYFGYKYSMTVDERLKYCPYGQAGVVYGDDGSINLYSYTTLVIVIDKDGWMTCTGTYSQTTRKHIGCFMKEYAPRLSYYTAKRCYEEKVTVNIYTGEEKSLED